MTFYYEALNDGDCASDTETTENGMLNVTLEPGKIDSNDRRIFSKYTVVFNSLVVEQYAWNYLMYLLLWRLFFSKLFFINLIVFLSLNIFFWNWILHIQVRLIKEMQPNVAVFRSTCKGEAIGVDC